MHFPHRSPREANNDGSRLPRPDHDVGLSFLYRPTRDRARLSHSAFPTYYSLEYISMPYFSKNNQRSVHSNIQILLYNFLERPVGFKCFTYHFSVFLVVLVGLVLSVLTTIEKFSASLSIYVYWIEIFLVVFFGIEYVIRLWSAGCRSKYMGVLGRIRFARKPIAIVDLLVVVGSTLMITLAADRQAFAASAIRGVRFLQILRVLHVDRHGGTWRLLGSNDSHFDTYADALWWGVITITTIGYGDVYPVTWMGKIIASVFAIFAISFFALPAGILGSGFALKVQQKQRQKHFSRQIPAAATLIQAAWRVYASAPGSSCVATWNIYLRVVDIDFSPIVQKSFSTNHQTFSERTAEKLRHLRLSSAQRKQRSKRASQNPSSPSLLQSPGFTDRRGSISSTSNTTGLENNDHDDEDFEEKPLKPHTLTEDHKRAIRCVRKIQLIVARNRFQQARKPYDVRDVLEQYSHGHINMMMRIKELQRKIEHTIGKQPSGTSEDRAKLTVLARMQRVEGAITSMEKMTGNILVLLRTVDEKLDRISPNNSRMARSILTRVNEKFSSTKEEIS
ncbi:unnamed protein product [Rotaria magnacalcarata]|uniref:IKs producing slow voltage-gated potassium channel subunit alpha KvLQT1 n=1 Tax=Rotaria magnacalcarata TaxID=392030 RepID=A0A8S2N1H8_9BILA|nr:unnamed protein product [Rotaria magnacalcarata]